VAPSTIFGPTCDGLDKLPDTFDLPLLNNGDWLVFPYMGAAQPLHLPPSLPTPHFPNLTALLFSTNVEVTGSSFCFVRILVFLNPLNFRRVFMASLSQTCVEFFCVVLFGGGVI